MATTYFAAPTVQGTGDGLSEANAFLIADFWPLAEPGDTLILLDGTYTSASSTIDPQNVSGTQANRITVKSKNDGGAWINGGGTRRPVRLRNCHWMILEGFDASDSSDQVVHPHDGSTNIIFRRVVAWECGPGNRAVWQTSNGDADFVDRLLIEDCAGFGRGRKIFVWGRSHSDNCTLRRFWGMWNRAGNDGGNMTISAGYRSYNNIMENVIGTWDEDERPAGTRSGILKWDHMTGLDPPHANWRYFGSIGYLKSNQSAGEPGETGPAPLIAVLEANQQETTDLHHRHTIGYSEKAHVRTARLRKHGDFTGPIDYSAHNVTEAGAGVANASISNDWDQVNNVREENVANVPNIFNGAGSLGARISHRYENGVLTDELLWPWPMDARIRQALTRDGRDPDAIFGGVGNGVTEQIEALFGTIPSELRWDSEPGAGTATLDQLAFRFRNDDGSETTATWKAATNTNISIPIGECFRLRLGVGDTAAGEELAVGLRLQINRNGTGWVNSSGSSGPVRTSLNSTNYANGDDTTQQITTGTFINPNGGMRHANLAPGGSTDFVATENDRVELEFGLCGIAGELSDGDKVQFRVIRESNGQPLDAYSQTPEVTFTGETAPGEVLVGNIADGTTGTNTLTISNFEVVAGDGGVILAFASQVAPSPDPITAITFNGTEEFSKVSFPSGDSLTNSVLNASWWVLKNPSVATADIVATRAGTSGDIGLNVIHLTGADLVDTFRDTDDASGLAVSSNSLTLDSVLGDMLLSGLLVRAADGVTPPDPVADDGTVIADLNVPNARNRHASLRKAASGGATTAVGWSWSNPERWIHMALTVAAETTTITAALSGTATADIQESDVRTGGKTVIWTLTGDTWVSGATFDNNKLGLATNLLSDVNPAAGWNNEVIPAIAAGDIVRTSDTVVTLTLPAVASYDIGPVETIQSTVPANLLTNSGGNIVVSPTFTVTPDPVTLPNVVTDAATSITASSAQLNGELELEGGSTVTRLGFVYDPVSRTAPGNVSPETSAYANVTDVDGASFPEDFYSKVVSGLASSTQYFFRIFAQNTSGFAYGNELDFTTEPVDGNTILSGSGDLTSIGEIILDGAAGLISSGTLDADADIAIEGTAALSGSGTLSATGAAAIEGTAGVGGSGTLSATAQADIVEGTASLGGSGAVSAAAFLEIDAAALLSGSGKILASAEDAIDATASLLGSGALEGSAVLVLNAGTARITGFGTLSATGVRTHSAEARILGLGALSGDGDLLLAASALLASSGSLDAAGAVASEAAARLAATGILRATGTSPSFGDPFQHTTLSILRNRLRQRLGDPADNSFWADAELNSHINEALRVWNLIVGQWTASRTVATTSNTLLYNNPLLVRTATDQQILNEIQFHLLETPNQGASMSSDIWELQDLISSINNKYRRLASETKLLLRREIMPGSTGQDTYELPADVIDIHRISYGSSGLERTSAHPWDNLLSSWPSVSRRPLAYSVVHEPSLSFRLIPTPSTNESIDLFVTFVPSDLSNTGQIVQIPNDFVPFIKWGALWDLLKEEGQAHDPVRAQYCEARFREGLALADLYVQEKVSRRAQIAGQTLRPTSTFSLDCTKPGWHTQTGPPKAWFPVGATLFGLHPIDSAPPKTVTIFGVTDAPVLANPNDPIDLGQWELDAILDYAQHVAAFKQGPGEFESTFPLYQNFISKAILTSGKRDLAGLYRQHLGPDLDEFLRPFKHVVAEPENQIPS